MKFRYGSAFLGIPLILISALAFADGIPDRGNEQLDEMDISLLQKYGDTPMDRAPAHSVSHSIQDAIHTRTAHPLTVSAIDQKEGAEDLSGPATPPTNVKNIR
jgi:hypothetical protein